jgi:hypothetical protein
MAYDGVLSQLYVVVWYGDLVTAFILAICWSENLEGFFGVLKNLCQKMCPKWRNCLEKVFEKW